MRTKAIIKYIGYALLFNSFFLVISAAISFFNGESSFVPLIVSFLGCSIAGLLPQIFVKEILDINFHEGVAITVFGWIVTCLFGAIPYALWGGEFSIVDAIFESVSGYTTTGATILQDVEKLTNGLLFWRSSTHFLGGIGVILFVLLILPDAKGVQTSIYKSEVSNLSLMSFRMRSKHIVKSIAIVYIILNAVLTLLLWVQGMSFFDSICHSFATIATGGFSTKNLSVSYYDNVGIELTITIFMYLSSLHFGMLFLTITGSNTNIFKSKVVRSFTIILLIGITLIAFDLVSENGYSIGEGFRHASFQVVSLASTTGFASIDTNVWPIFSKILMLYFMLQCAMVGSTGGGIKFDRVYLYFVSLNRQMKQLLHPKGLYIAKMDGNVITEEMEYQTMVHIILYIIVFFVVTLLLAAMHVDGMTALSISISTIGNVGPGFNEISSLGNYSQLPSLAKYLLSANMLVGRLEILNVFTLFVFLFKKGR